VRGWRRWTLLWHRGHLTEEALSAYLDGALSPREGEAVEAHLARCGACRVRGEGMGRVVALLRSLPPEPVPRPVVLPEGAVPAPARPLLRWGAGLLTAMAVALLALVGADLAGVGSPSPTPPVFPTPAPGPAVPAEGGAGESLRSLAVETGPAEPTPTLRTAPTPTPMPGPAPSAPRGALRWWPVELALGLATAGLALALRLAQREPRRPRERLKG